MARRDQETETTPEVVDDPQQIGIEEALEPATLEEEPESDFARAARGEIDDDDAAPAPSLAEQLTNLTAQEREQLVREVEALTVREHASREDLKAGDYTELAGHAYVKFPDGSVVTASRQILLGQPGEYVVTYWGEGQGSETFTVAEKDAEA